MKSILIFITFIALSMISCENTSNKISNTCDNCGRFKNGKFEVIYRFGDISHKQYVERNDSTQIDSLKPNERFTYSLNWLSPCIYQVFIIDASDCDYKNAIDSLCKTPVTIEIIDCDDDYYIQRMSTQNSITRIDTIWVAK